MSTLAQIEIEQRVFYRLYSKIFRNFFEVSKKIKVEVDQLHFMRFQPSLPKHTCSLWK
jgi:hypothetical protein